MGLRYRDGEERFAYGIAIIDTATGKVSYHRAESAAAAALAAEKKAPKMLPIPAGVVDADVRGESAWFATSEGVARLAGGEVTVWSEATGLRSELARAVAIAADGSVFVATGAGAGRWDGKAWDFPGALRFEIKRRGRHAQRADLDGDGARHRGVGRAEGPARRYAARPRREPHPRRGGGSVRPRVGARAGIADLDLAVMRATAAARAAEPGPASAAGGHTITGTMWHRRRGARVR